VTGQSWPGGWPKPARSSGGRLKPVVWPAKADLLLWWPSSGSALADLVGLSRPGSQRWPVRLVKIDFVEILHNFNDFSIVSLLVVRLTYDSNKHENTSLNENRRSFAFSFLRVINLSYLSLTWH
jgi:hypothetical protein